MKMCPKRRNDEERNGEDLVAVYIRGTSELNVNVWEQPQIVVGGKIVSDGNWASDGPVFGIACVLVFS